MTAVRISSSIYRLAADKLRVLFSHKYLLYTNTGICVGMSCLADFSQQYLQIRKKELPHMNLRRSRDVGVTGFMIGPFCHYWYMVLDKWFPGKAVKIVAKKIIVDQFVCSPVIIVIFLGTTLYLEGKIGTTLISEMYQKGKILYLADWLIWPPAQAVNFFFLPTRFRVLYDNCISFVYDCYFSHVRYGKAHNSSESVCDSVQEDTSSHSHTDNISSEIGMVTGSHVPSINMQVSEMVREKTKQRRLKIQHITLHTDNIATDMDVTVDHEDQTEKKPPQSTQENKNSCSTAGENIKRTDPSSQKGHID